MSYDIKDKTILITGANRGIGEALVDSFINHGAVKIYAAVRVLDSASALVKKYGDKIVPVYIDLAEPYSTFAAAQKATDVDVVINNAGVLKTTTPLDKDAIDSLEFEMSINVYGLIYMAQAFAPILKANGGGVFAQLNSVASLRSFPNIATYSASKAAAYSITQALREILAEQGTAVLSIHPGPIATDMANDAGFDGMGEPASVVAESVIAALRAGDFHVFPDSVAQNFGEEYKSFADNVVEADVFEEHAEE